MRACERAGGRGEAKLCARVRRCCFLGWVDGGPFVLRGVAPPQVRWVGVSQSLLVILDRGMSVGDEKGELDSLVGCWWMLLDAFLRCKAGRGSLGPSL